MKSGQSPHVRHKATFQMVKIQGVLLDDPSRRVVSVYDEDDWHDIHRNPSVRVGCMMRGCPTLLTAKVIARTGTRFLATRSGGCTHFEVKPPVPEASAGGGGAETKEHDWVKGRLARVAASVNLEAIIEDARTRADVYLPGPKIALEYQRVATDFDLRTRMRRAAGASRTLWLIAQQPLTTGPKNQLQKMFDEQVFQRGGLYLSVVDVDDYRTTLRPWENPSALNCRACLRVSGSVAGLSPEGDVFTRRGDSCAQFLADVAEGVRVLERVPIRPAKGGGASMRLAWVRATELERYETERAARAARATAPAPEVAAELPTATAPEADEGPASVPDAAEPPAAAAPERPAPPEQPTWMQPSYPPSLAPTRSRNWMQKLLDRITSWMR